MTGQTTKCYRLETRSSERSPWRLVSFIDTADDPEALAEALRGIRRDGASAVRVDGNVVTIADIRGFDAVCYTLEAAN